MMHGQKNIKLLQTCCASKDD